MFIVTLKKKKNRFYTDPPADCHTIILGHVTHNNIFTMYLFGKRIKNVKCS